MLLCDDQSVMRAGFTAILSSQPDIEVVGEASTGALAVQEARRLRPDVVVMDIQMPGTDGIEATRQLAGPNATGLTAGQATTLKVLIVTNFNLDEYVYQARPREREVLSLIATGMSNAEIAGSLFISAETVKTYVSRILAKLGLRDRVQAVVFAYQEGLVSVRD